MSEDSIFKIELFLSGKAYQRLDTLAKKHHLTPDLMLTQIVLDRLNKGSEKQYSYRVEEEE